MLYKCLGRPCTSAANPAAASSVANCSRAASTLRALGVGLCLGDAELAEEDGRTRHFNTAITVDKTGAIVARYRKIHLPGHDEQEPWQHVQHLQKRSYEAGNLGLSAFRASFGDGKSGIFGMANCNDRHWSETYRVLGLQGFEMILIGYNTPVHNPPPVHNKPAPAHDALSHLHNQFVMQSGACQNGTWVVGVAKAGNE